MFKVISYNYTKQFSFLNIMSQLDIPQCHQCNCKLYDKEYSKLHQHNDLLCRNDNGNRSSTTPTRYYNISLWSASSPSQSYFIDVNKNPIIWKNQICNNVRTWTHYCKCLELLNFKNKSWMNNMRSRYKMTLFHDMIKFE